MASTLQDLQAEVARLQARYRVAQNGLATLNRNLQSNRAIIERYTLEVSSIPNQVASLEAQINAIQKTSGTTASQAASDDASKGPNKSAPATVNSNGRIVTPPATTTPSNADKPDTGAESTGTDAPVRTIEQTQSFNTSGQAVISEDGTVSNLRKNPETGELYDPGGPIEPKATLEAGVGAPSDDAANKSAATISVDANAAQAALKIQPKANPLDRFFSYTYSASVYMLTTKQYETLLRSKQKKIDGYFLLFQSGGAPSNFGGAKSGMGESSASGSADTQEQRASQNATDSGRNPFFDNDFYIDSITLDTSPLGKVSGASHMTASMKFTVIEPMGITLIDRLYQAAQNLQQKDPNGTVNYTATDYLMVIRFYGYDQNGNAVQISGGLGDAEGTSDSKALIEKFIPFKIANLNWSVGSKLVTYEWDCVPQGQLIGGYTARGSVPYDVQLVDSTVSGLLGGSAKYSGGTAGNNAPGASTTSAAQSERDDAAAVDAGKPPPKAQAAPSAKKTITQGLMGAMNDFQEDLVNRGIYTYPDRYSIEFVGKPDMPASAISDAKLQLPATKVDKAKTASGQPPTTSGGTKNLKPEVTSVDNVSRSFSITAGQMVTQAIELAIRNSNYITDQALVVLQPDGTSIANPNSRNKPMQWFNITMSAVARSPMDPKRNDYAYDIKYTVSPFTPGNFNSKYFPTSKFAGVHKKYPYWFTGQNTAVLEYQETLNALYAITVSGSDPENSAAAVQRKNWTSSMRDIAKYSYSPRSTESSQGADGKSNELGANAAEYLFSPGDLANCKLKIIGDPDWIQQGSLFREVTATGFVDSSVTGFGVDGSVAFDAGDAMFEIVWQRPNDYDLQTGLADPFAKSKDREPVQSRVYIVTKCISEFRQGKFEQTLEGSLFTFPIPQGTNAVNPSAAKGTNKGDGDNSNSAGGGAGGGKSSVSANKTAETAKRTGLSLSAEQAQAARNDFAKRDPRLVTNSDGGKAAILGAQGAYREAQFANNGGGAPFGNPSIARQGITAGALKIAGAPGTPTSNGASVPARSSGSIPPKLPQGNPDPTSSTDPSNQQIAGDGG